LAGTLPQGIPLAFVAAHFTLLGSWCAQYPDLDTNVERQDVPSFLTPLQGFVAEQRVAMIDIATIAFFMAFNTGRLPCAD
jgi:hypothetical protein